MVFAGVDVSLLSRLTYVTWQMRQTAVRIITTLKMCPKPYKDCSERLARGESPQEMYVLRNLKNCSGYQTAVYIFDLHSHLCYHINSYRHIIPLHHVETGSRCYSHKLLAL
jgi:hypothetical protein